MKVLLVLLVIALVGCQTIHSHPPRQSEETEICLGICGTAEWDCMGAAKTMEAMDACTQKSGACAKKCKKV